MRAPWESLLDALVAAFAFPSVSPCCLGEGGRRRAISDPARGERGTSIRVTRHPVMPPAGGEMAVWSPDG